MIRDNSMRKIILVESSKKAAKVWRSKVQNRKTVIEHFETAEICLETLMNTNGYNLIICDYELADKNGEDLCLDLKIKFDEGKLKKKYHKMFILMSSNMAVQDIARRNSITFIKKPETDLEWREALQTLEYKLQQTTTIILINDMSNKLDNLTTKVDRIDKSVDRIDDSVKLLDGKMNSFMSEVATTQDKILNHIDKINPDRSNDKILKEVEEVEEELEEIKGSLECEVPKEPLRGLAWIRQMIEDLSDDVLFVLVVKIGGISLFLMVVLWGQQPQQDDVKLDKKVITLFKKVLEGKITLESLATDAILKNSNKKETKK